MILYDERLDLIGSEVDVNLTFKTKSLEDGAGSEERIIRWASPLLSFDLRQDKLSQAQKDYLIDFFRTVSNVNYFRYRDCSDFEATATPKLNSLGSHTQGILLPDADGIETEFQLFKVYFQGDSIHYRAINHPEQLTIYENAIETSNWSEDNGKITFVSPPAQNLTADFLFDVPVALATPELKFKTKMQGTTSVYQLETVTLEEIREEAAFYPQDILGGLGTFDLVKYKESLTTVKDETEIIDLSSGYDLRTARYQQQKGVYALPQASIRHERLEHLISFWRNCKGKGINFYFNDKSYRDGYVSARFDSDNLRIKLKPNELAQIQPINLIETLDNIPFYLTIEGNENLEVAEVIPGGGGGNGSPSQFLVNTTVSVPSGSGGETVTGGSGAGGNYSVIEEAIGIIVAITEIQGILFIHTWKDFGSHWKCRIYREQTSQNLDFIKIWESVDIIQSNYSDIDFIDISSSSKGLVFSYETFGSVVKLLALAVDLNGVSEDEIDLTGLQVTYSVHSFNGNQVFMQTEYQILNATTVNNAGLDWASLGMQIYNTITLEGREYRLSGDTIYFGTNSYGSFLPGVVLDGNLLISLNSDNGATYQLEGQFVEDYFSCIGVVSGIIDTSPNSNNLANPEVWTGISQLLHTRAITNHIELPPLEGEYIPATALMAMVDHGKEAIYAHHEDASGNHFTGIYSSSSQKSLQPSTFGNIPVGTISNELLGLYRTYDAKLIGTSQVKRHLRLKLSKFLKP